MKFIGLTGGVGAGKTTVLKAIKQLFGVRILVADEIAHELMRPGSACYEQLKGCFGELDIWNEDGSFNRPKLATVLFSDEEKRKKLDAIVHPAVKKYILEEVEKERAKGEVSYVILEAALLIEDHYDTICDELWYVYTDAGTRKQRLMADRGYSEEKVEQIFASQLSDETYRRYCVRIIDNNGDETDVLEQIKAIGTM